MSKGDSLYQAEQQAADFNNHPNTEINNSGKGAFELSSQINDRIDDVAHSRSRLTEDVLIFILPELVCFY